VTETVGVEDGLATEREYVRDALRKGVLRGVGQGVRGEPEGLARTGAIVAGLGVTTWGYGIGRMRTRRTARSGAATA